MPGRPPKVNARVRLILSLGNFSPRTAVNPKQIVLSMLITPLIILLPMLMMMLFVNGPEDLGHTASTVVVSTLLGTLLLGPV